MRGTEVKTDKTISLKQYWNKKFDFDFEGHCIEPDIYSEEESCNKICEGSLDTSLFERLSQITSENDLLLYVFLLAAFKITLYKYSGKTRTSVVSPSLLNKKKANNRGNLIPVISDILPSASVKELIVRLQEQLINDYKHQDYSYENILKDYRISMDLDDSVSLSNTQVDFNSIHTQKEVDSIDIKLSFIKTGVSETQKNISCHITYNSSLYSQDAIKKLTVHYENILRQMIENPSQKIMDLEMINKDEKERVLKDFNGKEFSYPSEKTIHRLIEEASHRSPEAEAVVCQNKSITYRELNEKSGKLASYLIKKGVKKGDIVAVYSSRRVELIVALLGIMKAGGAYLPIDPKLPCERIRFMLNDSDVSIVLTDKSDLSLAQGITAVDLRDRELYSCPQITASVDIQSRDLMYVIYTSGSTGQPKGTLVSHRSLVNFLYCINDHFPEQISNQDRCFSLTNISFDVSVCEIFLPLIFGGTLWLYPETNNFDLNVLADVFVREKITFAYLPPTLLQMLYEKFNMVKEDLCLDKLLVGVESIKRHVLDNFMSLKRDMTIINGYGPTEATICATFYKYETCPLSIRENTPIGKPLYNSTVYIVNRDNQLQPVGISGELCISGDSLALGYLNREEMTEKKFVSNPFRPGEKMYRTGDVAQWDNNGHIRFMGRWDNQVKIRGYRVEIQEVEKKIIEHKNVKDAVVLTKNDGNNNYLAAYILSEQNSVTEEIRNYLHLSLPDYMVPSHFILLKEFPVTPNGKINRKALPDPLSSVGQVQKMDITLAETEAEKLISGVWSELFNVEEIDVNTTFYDLGGHSLVGTAIISRLQEKLNKKIPQFYILKSPTIKKLARDIEKLMA